MCISLRNHARSVWKFYHKDSFGCSFYWHPQNCKRLFFNIQGFLETPENPNCFQTNIFRFWLSEVVPIWSCVYPEIFSLRPLWGKKIERYQVTIKNGGQSTWPPPTIFFAIRLKNSFFAWKFQDRHNLMLATTSDSQTLRQVVMKS